VSLFLPCAPSIDAQQAYAQTPSSLTAIGQEQASHNMVLLVKKMASAAASVIKGNSFDDYF